MEEFTIISNTYRFDCTRCGNCCTGDQKVFLNLYDLYKLARFHKFSNTKKLFDSRIVLLVQDQNQAYLPRLRFKLKPYSFCPFLIHEQSRNHVFKTRCMLHPEYKPLICSLAPAGRVIDLDKNSDDFIFVKPAPDCPGVRSQKENSLTELKKTYQQELEYQYSFFRMLQKARAAGLSRNDYLEEIYFFNTEQAFTALTDE